MGEHCNGSILEAEQKGGKGRASSAFDMKKIKRRKNHPRCSRVETLRCYSVMMNGTLENANTTLLDARHNSVPHETRWCSTSLLASNNHIQYILHCRTSFFFFDIWRIEPWTGIMFSGMSKEFEGKTVP